MGIPDTAVCGVLDAIACRHFQACFAIAGHDEALRHDALFDHIAGNIVGTFLRQVVVQVSRTGCVSVAIDVDDGLGVFLQRFR